MGVLCVVGAAGKLETSANHGASWTARTSGTANALRGVASKPDATLVVAVGDSGTVTTSGDQGATWTLRTGPNSTDNLTGIAWNGTRWVASGYNTGGAGGYTNAIAWTSTDGVTWTASTVVATIFGLNPESLAVAVLSTTFYVAVSSGANGANIPAGVYTSTNGTTWTKNTGFSTAAPAEDASFQTLYSPQIIACDGSRLMVGALTGSSGGSAFFTSVDGSAWAAAGSVFINPRGLAGYGSGWVTVGNYTDARAAYTTTNDFTGAVPVAPGISSGAVYSVCWEGTKYAGAGSDGSVYTSSTGASWTANATNTANAKYGIGNIPNSAPTASLLLTPSNNASLDLTQAQSFTWSFQDPDLPLDSQKAYALKIVGTSPVSAAQWWDGSAMQASETYVTSTTNGATVGAGLIGSNGNTYSWSVITKDQLNTAGTYSSTRSFTGSLPPVAAVTAPSGTVSNTTTPTVTWTYTDPEATAQESYRVKIFSAAQYLAGGFDASTSTAVYDSGQVFSAVLTATVGTDLTNGTTYRAYVQVTQIGAQASLWAYSGFTVSITLPATPTLAVQADTSRARIVLTAAGTITPYSSASYRFEYHDGDGNWQSVLNGTVTVPSTFTYSVTDYLSRPSAQRFYRVSTVAGLSSTTQVSSDYSGVQIATLVLDTAWLKHKTDPTLNMAVKVRKGYGWTQGSAAQIYNPLGSTVAVVLDDVPKGVSQTLSIETSTSAEKDALQALIDAKAALLFQDPMGEQHWIWTAGQVTRQLQVGTQDWWVWSVPVVEVAEPTS